MTLELKSTWHHCSAECMWRQQKQSMTDEQSYPYVVLCSAGATKSIGPWIALFYIYLCKLTFNFEIWLFVHWVKDNTVKIVLIKCIYNTY